MKSLTLVAALGLSASLHAAPAVATFDDLGFPPALDGATGLQWADAAGLNYKGVLWDERFTVVGDQYRIGSGTPLFGKPHDGHFFVTNQSAVSGGEFTNDHLFITTSQVLTEAWFGQNEYYGFGAGADEITVFALNGVSVLGSVSMALPDLVDGQPEDLQRMDLSSFLGLSGITGYRIDRHERGTLAGNWIGDHFVFVDAPVGTVPEAPSLALVGLGLLGLGASLRRRAQR